MKNSIRIERSIKNLTQEGLGKMVHVSRQTINSIEHGKFIPSTIVAMRIARVFQKKVDDIFWLEEFD